MMTNKCANCHEEKFSNLDDEISLKFLQLVTLRHRRASYWPQWRLSLKHLPTGPTWLLSGCLTPAAWFATAEGHFSLDNVVDEQRKYYIVLAPLPGSTVNLVADLLAKGVLLVSTLNLVADFLVKGVLPESTMNPVVDPLVRGVLTESTVNLVADLLVKGVLTESTVNLVADLLVRGVVSESTVNVVVDLLLKGVLTNSVVDLVAVSS
jgi:hypothetical protein